MRREMGRECATVRRVVGVPVCCCCWVGQAGEVELSLRAVGVPAAGAALTQQAILTCDIISERRRAAVF